MSQFVDFLRTKAARTGVYRWILRRALLFVAVAAVVIVVLDFANFTREVMRATPSSGPNADAIVVLTGGADRIKGAANLLRGGHASRLLISGVHPDTTIDEIARSAGIAPVLLSCCVDLDHLAANTIENAEQTKLWAERLKFGSLIVVTSAYHMPRSMAELGHVMPQVDLVPYPVVRQGLGLDRWYVKPSTVRLVAAEYAKYLLARFRMRLEAPHAPSQVAQAL